MPTPLHVDRSGHSDKHKEKLLLAVSHLHPPLCYLLRADAEKVHLVEQTPKNFSSVHWRSNESAPDLNFSFKRNPPLTQTLPGNCAVHTHEKSQASPHLYPSPSFSPPASSLQSVTFTKAKSLVWQTLNCDITLCAGWGSLLQFLHPADWKAKGPSLVVDDSNAQVTAAGCFHPRHPAPHTSRSSRSAAVLEVHQTACPKAPTRPFSQEFIAPLNELPSSTDPELGHTTRSLLLWIRPHKPPKGPWHSPMIAVAAAPSTLHSRSRRPGWIRSLGWVSVCKSQNSYREKNKSGGRCTLHSESKI